MENVLAFCIVLCCMRHTSVQYIGLKFLVKVNRAMPIRYLELIFLWLDQKLNRSY